MRNTVQNRMKFSRELLAVMKASKEPAVAGEAWLANFQKSHAGDGIIDDLFHYYKLILDGRDLGQQIVPKRSPGWAAICAALSIGVLATITGYVILSDFSNLVKALTAIGICATVVTLVILLKFQHLYKISLMTAGSGLISAPFWPQYHARVAAPIDTDHGQLSAPASIDAGLQSATLDASGVCCIAIGAMLMFSAALLHYRES